MASENILDIVRSLWFVATVIAVLVAVVWLGVWLGRRRADQEARTPAALAAKAFQCQLDAEPGRWFRAPDDFGANRGEVQENTSMRFHLDLAYYEVWRETISDAQSPLFVRRRPHPADLPIQVRNKLPLS